MITWVLVDQWWHITDNRTRWAIQWLWPNPERRKDY